MHSLQSQYFKIVDEVANLIVEYFRVSMDVMMSSLISPPLFIYNTPKSPSHPRCWMPGLRISSKDNFEINQLSSTLTTSMLTIRYLIRS